MDKSDNPCPIPDNNFYKSSSLLFIAHLLPYVLAIGAKEGKKKIEIPVDLLASLTEKYTPEDFDMWLLKNQGVDFLQTPEE